MRLPDTHELLPRLGLAIGALSISASAVLLGLAHTTAATATVGRCLFALPFVAAGAAYERRRTASVTCSGYFSALACGALFCADMLLWTQAIPEVGAGLSTVLVNAQIAIVPLLAVVIDHERVAPRFWCALPVVLGGIALAGGVFEHGLTGNDPVRGTLHAVGAALAYSGFLFLLRRGGQSGQPMQTYAVVLATAAVLSAVVGPWWHGLDVAPGWPVVGWLALVTVTGQLLGWLLIAVYSPSVPSHVSSALLLLTPIGAVVLGTIVLAERPSLLQLFGCALVLIAGYLGAAGRATERAHGSAS